MGRPTSALIVDDEPHVRAFLRLLLREVGIHQTWEAADGARGLEMAAEHKPELILLDVNLPVMTGIEALAQLKQNDPDLPVIMVSSQSAIPTVMQALKLGANAYVLKHSPKDEAIATLRETLDGLDEDAGEEETDTQS